MKQIQNTGLRKICNKTPIDKTSFVNLNDNSSFFTQRLLYSKYVGGNRRIYSTITEGQVNSITMISSTPYTATIAYTYISTPIQIDMIVVNIQNSLDTHLYTSYSSPFTLTGLMVNSYYTINAYAVFRSGNKYLNTFVNAAYTLTEEPVLANKVVITNEQFDSAVMTFATPIGNLSYVDLNVINHLDNTTRYFYHNIKSPFTIYGLQPNVLYDISLSSYYTSSTNHYNTYISSAFETYNENYPVFNQILHLTNKSVTVQYSFTGTPIYNALILTNAMNANNTYPITIYDNNTNQVSFTGLMIDTSYNLSITTVYDVNGELHTYPKSFPSICHTYNESAILGISSSGLLGNGFNITFVSAPGTVDNYILQLTNNTTHTSSSSTFTSNPGIISFTTLDRFTNYTIIITSYYADALGGFRNYSFTPYSISTLNEGPVSNTSFSVSNIGNTFATITFLPAPGNPDYYVVTYKGSQNNITLYTFTLSNTSNLSTNLTELSIYTSYTVTITTFYSDGNSYFYSTNPDVFTTLNEGPTTIQLNGVTASPSQITFTITNAYNLPSYLVFVATDIYTNVSVSSPSVVFTTLNIAQTYTFDGLTASVYRVYINTFYNTTKYITTYPSNITVPAPAPNP